MICGKRENTRMNSKVAYLLLGILISKTLDEWKALTKLRADDLEKRKERLAKYPGNPAVQAGSMEHHRIVCEQEWANSVAPELARLTRKQRVWQFMPFVVCLVLTVAVFGYILIVPDHSP